MVTCLNQTFSNDVTNLSSILFIGGLFCLEPIGEISNYCYYKCTRIFFTSMVIKMGKLRWKMLYEGTMIILVIISLVAIVSNEESNFRYIHQIIWFVFLIDVVVRFIRTSVKWKYIKDNPFDIVTVIPLEDIMLLGRFARFIRLFRYKNLVKRYVDGISQKLKEFGFLRLSVSIILINVLVSLLLVLFGGFSFINSTIWVWGNFLKFNYETNVEHLILLSIVIKIQGLIYYGILIRELMTVGRSKYERYKRRKKGSTCQFPSFAKRCRNNIQQKKNPNNYKKMERAFLFALPI